MKKTIAAGALIITLAVAQAVPQYGGNESAIGVPPAGGVAFAQSSDVSEAGIARFSPASLASTVKTSVVNRTADTIRLLWKLNR